MSLTIKNVEKIPSDAREYWPGNDIRSSQCFPATGNFDLEANAFGRLAVHNDDVVSPGEGFDMHQHDNMEIFTWVVDGRIAHRDSTLHPGKETIIERGTTTYINAGRGIRHAEVNADGYSSRSFLRVVQMWLLPDERNTDASYTTADVSEQIDSGELFLVAGAKGSGAPVETVSDSARLYAGVLAADKDATVALDRFTHVYVVRGGLRVNGPTEGVEAKNAEGYGADGVTLDAGDQFRVVAEGDTADGATELQLTSLEPDTEILIWTMQH